jgi:hypothetical protein
LIGIVGGLLAQSGGLQGLANKFSQSGQGNAFQSWVGMGEIQPVFSNQIQNVLGPKQVNTIATKLGVDPGIRAPRECVFTSSKQLVGCRQIYSRSPDAARRRGSDGLYRSATSTYRN